MQGSHTQALNLLQDSQVAEESTVRRPTPIKIVEQPMDPSDSSTTQTQRQPVTPVSFVSTTQIRMDTVVPPTVSQVTPQVSLVWVPLSQIKSVASMANMAASLKGTKIYGFWYQSYLQYLQGPSQGLTLLAG